MRACRSHLGLGALAVYEQIQLFTDHVTAPLGSSSETCISGREVQYLVSAWATYIQALEFRLLHACLKIQPERCPHRQQHIIFLYHVKGGVMAQPAFGLLLQRLREQRGLSLRELGQLAGIDHAYIYRLEAGDKESPSEEILTKLVRALKSGKREADMLRYLAKQPQ